MDIRRRLERLEQDQGHRTLEDLRNLSARSLSDDELAMLIRNDAEAVVTDIDDEELERTIAAGRQAEAKDESA